MLRRHAVSAYNPLLAGEMIDGGSVEMRGNYPVIQFWAVQRRGRPGRTPLHQQMLYAAVRRLLAQNNCTRATSDV